MQHFFFSEYACEYIHSLVYFYQAYVAVCASESLAFLRSFLDRFECIGYSFFCDLRDMESGSIIVDEIERQMRLTGSLIIVYDNSFFNDAMAKFTIEVGKQIQLGNQYFKLIVLEVKPILAEHLRFFKSFSRITVKKHYEERAYQQILKILTGTGILLTFHPPASEFIEATLIDPLFRHYLYINKDVELDTNSVY